jgi:UDP-glucose 4-epimerase
MRVLVSGANGFLGRAVVAELLRRGHRVRAMARSSRGVAELESLEGVEVYRADLSTARELGSAFESIDVLVHLAAAMGGDAAHQLADTVAGTERLLEAMGQSATRRLVFASSFSVYDKTAAGGEISESSPIETEPGLLERDGYAIAKVSQERCVRALASAHGFDLIVLRPGIIWGREHFDPPGLCQRVGPLSVVVGAGNELPLTHVDNCAHLFATCVDDARVVVETFNVIDGHRQTAWSYLKKVDHRSGRKRAMVALPYVPARLCVGVLGGAFRMVFRGRRRMPSVFVARNFDARFKPVRYAPSRAVEVLRWSPPLDFDECMRRTFAPNSDGIHDG